MQRSCCRHIKIGVVFFTVKLVAFVNDNYVVKFKTFCVNNRHNRRLVTKDFILVGVKFNVCVNNQLVVNCLCFGRSFGNYANRTFGIFECIFDVFANIGAGLWDTYNMASGLLGDVLSYIRLFALGLSGGVLAMVFNNIAVQMSPDVPVLGPIVMVIIFLFGHALNLFMNALGAFVHPLRLTFVEYFKNAGYEGKGEEYKPFKNE